MAGLFAVANQQVLEFAQSVSAYHIALISGDHVTIGPFADKDVEVVVPEVGHHFIQLAFTVDVAQQLDSASSRQPQAAD